MDKKKKIDVNSSSLVGLKAELYRKQEEFKKEKLERFSGSIPSGTKPKKSSSIWSKKKHQSVSQPKQDVEQLEKERLEIDRARSMLEVKTRLYEQMTSGNDIPDEQTNNIFLVDFEKKQLDKLTKLDPASNTAGSSKQDTDDEDILAPESDIPPPSDPDEEWIDYTDTLGRSRRCMKKDLPKLRDMDKKLNPDKFKLDATPKQDTPDVTPELMSEDMHRERMRKKWEQEQQELLDRGQSAIHYQNVRFDEVRTHGVAYFEFAKDQEMRDKQMDTLKLLRDETVNQRVKREELKAKRKAALEARLEKVRQRKKMKTGASEDPGSEANQATMECSSSGANQGDMQGTGVTGHKEEEEKGVETVDPNWQRTLRLVEAAKKESSKADREWDVAKEPKAWADQRTRIKNERPLEFAPPTDYTPAKWRKQGKRKWPDQGTGIREPASSDCADNIHSYGRNSSRGSDQQWSERIGERGMEEQEAPGNRENDSQEYLDGQQSNGAEQHRTSTAGTVIGANLLRGGAKNTVTSSLKLFHKGNDDFLGNNDIAGQKISDNSSYETEKLSSGHQPLIRTEGSKPIKFTLGGQRKSEKGLLGAATSLDDDDDIRKGLRSLRQGHIS